MEKTKKILLVEDDESDQFFFIQAMRNIPGTAIYNIANNGQEAIKKVKNADTLPDIIFSDINMPLMDGIEYLTEIRNNPRTKDIPVVMLSSDKSLIDTICALGASAFIKKPGDFHQLQKHLEKVLHTELKVPSDPKSKAALAAFLIIE
jgi:CheY-like chemotaxis protein